MTSTRTIAKLRERINHLDSVITTLTLENMNLKDEVMKYRERYIGLQSIFHTPGVLIQTSNRSDVPDLDVLDQIERGKNAKSRPFEEVVKELNKCHK